MADNEDYTLKFRETTVLQEWVYKCTYCKNQTSEMKETRLVNTVFQTWGCAKCAIKATLGEIVRYASFDRGSFEDKKEADEYLTENAFYQVVDYKKNSYETWVGLKDFEDKWFNGQLFTPAQYISEKEKESIERRAMELNKGRIDAPWIIRIALPTLSKTRVGVIGTAGKISRPFYSCAVCERQNLSDGSFVYIFKEFV